MTTMTFSERNKLAHKMGAFYEMGYWRFPSPDLARKFERQVAGLEWTDDQRAAMDTIVLPDGAVMEDLQGNFYNEQGEKL